MQEDAELLRRYVRERSQVAFAELVRRHLNLVYSVALRQVAGDVHLAEDVAQQVFAALARKAATLVDRPTLSGWLYRSTHFAASDVVRVERRRRAREQEAQTMHMQETSHPLQPPSTGADIDWEKIRPIIDAAIAGLDERDRDAVSLRFFDGCSFSDVGARLRLTENAARMRVERALDKLHATLSRQGVTSTASALGLALVNQATVGVPAGLAASIAGAALTGTTAGTAGVLAFISTSKIVAGLGAGVTAAALGVAVVHYDGRKDAEAALAAAEQQHHAQQRDLATLNTRLVQAERRAVEAEKDSGDLLKAVEAERTAQATRAARVAQNTGPASRSPEEEARLAQERAYQQELAKRRAKEAIARATIQSEAAAEKDPVARYHKFIEAAENFAANADFPAAIATLNDAMERKPADLVVTDRVRQLQATLREQNTPVEISLISDGLTIVSVSGPYGNRHPSPLATAQVKLLPANYEVIGRRKGYQDVVIPVQVRSGVPAPVVSVACTMPAAP